MPAEEINPHCWRMLLRETNGVPFALRVRSRGDLLGKAMCENRIRRNSMKEAKRTKSATQKKYPSNAPAPR